MTKHGFRGNIERMTLRNTQYRKILYTDSYQQLVLMSVPPGGDIPWESHKGSQFIRVESGRGTAEFLGKTHRLSDGVSVIIPPRTRHYVKNTGTDSLKLYAVYSPPEH